MERQCESDDGLDGFFVNAERKLSGATIASSVVATLQRRDSGIITEFVERKHELNVVLRRLV